MHDEAVIDFLEGRGAATLEHPGGTLLAHLRRTAATLERWGCSRPLVVAGLAHAVYGTDGFPVPLATLEERPTVRDVLGTEAEAIVYRYCASDRRVTWDAVASEVVAYRDRFTGDERTIEGDELRHYWTLTAANELDLVPLVPGWVEAVVPLLRRGRHLLPAEGAAALS